MQVAKGTRLQVKVDFTDGGESPSLQAYAYSNSGALIGSAPVMEGTASFEVPAELNGRTMEIILGPPVEKGQAAPSAANLKRMGAYAKPVRYLAEKPHIDFHIPSDIFPHWCLCYIHGRLVKRVTLPNGTIVERPVCNARVHICEVDRLKLVISKLPDLDIYRLRDDLIKKYKIVVGPIPGPNPPDPGPIMPMMQTRSLSSASPASASRVSPEAMLGLTEIQSVEGLRANLIDLSSLIIVHLCDLIYLWPYFTVDCLTTVYADGQGRFHTIIGYNCNDQPDLYFWVEQFQGGAWHTVYRPSIGCGTHWNYVCGTEVVINMPGAIACDDPNYDVPPGVTLFVLPWAIGNSPIWGIPTGAPAAPDGWVRSNGLINYHDGSSLGWLNNAPFGGTLNLIHDDSYFIPSAGIKYYRYSYRRRSMIANTGAGDPSWTPITTPLARGYRMEYSDRLPTYEAYPVGPETHGTNSGLFQFKPQNPPARPTDPATVVVREWTSGNLSEVAASWDTTQAAPAISPSNVSDDAGDFQVKLEVFDTVGNQIMPGAATFQFLNRNADGTSTRLSTAAEIAGGAYILNVHVDNNGVDASLPQPSIDGVAASDDCGFLRYEPGDSVHIQYLAAHHNNHAVFGFGITRGSNGLATASTLAPYVEVAAVSAPTGSITPYVKSAGYYQRDFDPNELVGTCVNAAFAASLGVYGKATNGYQRLGIDAYRLIAFALAEQDA